MDVEFDGKCSRIICSFHSLKPAEKDLILLGFKEHTYQIWKGILSCIGMELFFSPSLLYNFK